MECKGYFAFDGDVQLPVFSAAKGRELIVAPLRTVTSKLRSGLVKVCAAAALATGLAIAVAGAAQAETRSLKLYFVHTGERATITFKRNGKFDPEGLAKLNRFLRDWRRNEPTKMDPRLFDLIWTVYQKSGSSDYINVLCGYRSPGTNEMLRNRSRHTGVAKESQHILGKAMDFYIPGVPLERLREIGLKLQMGGVGYYPTSGSPFVHMDVGGVRAWPRASREVLARLFPDGKTIHLPPDGNPLPGYEAAMADYKRRMKSEDIQVASVGGGRSRNLLQMLFGGGDEDESPDAIASNEAPAAKPASQPQTQVASAAPPAQPKQAYIENLPGVGAAANAPVPAVRPALSSQPGNASDLETALVSPARSAASAAMASVLEPTQDDGQQYADLQQYKIPVPELLSDRRLPGEADVPTPGSRPSYEVASADAAEANAGDRGLIQPVLASASDQAQPGPAQKDEIAAMIRRMSADEPASYASAPKPAPRPQVVASVAPASGARPQLARPIAADIRPALSSDGYQPKKGARPGRSEAIAALRGTQSDGKLTGKLIEQWALASNLVTRTARRNEKDDEVARPGQDATAGFKTQAVKFDSSRFYGASDVR